MGLRFFVIDPDGPAVIIVNGHHTLRPALLVDHHDSRT
jgi:hypothetical protein